MTGLCRRSKIFATASRTAKSCLRAAVSWPHCRRPAPLQLLRLNSIPTRICPAASALAQRAHVSGWHGTGVCLPRPARALHHLHPRPRRSLRRPARSPSAGYHRRRPAPGARRCSSTTSTSTAPHSAACTRGGAAIAPAMTAESWSERPLDARLGRRAGGSRASASLRSTGRGTSSPGRGDSRAGGGARAIRRLDALGDHVHAQHRGERHDGTARSPSRCRRDRPCRR